MLLITDVGHENRIKTVFYQLVPAIIGIVICILMARVRILRVVNIDVVKGGILLVFLVMISFNLDAFKDGKEIEKC